MFELNKRYNFTTIAPITLSQFYKNMKVIAANMNFKVAVKFSDVITTRQKIIRETGKNLLDPHIVSYTMFENEAGETVILADDWIDPNSIVLVETVDLTIKLPNVTTDDMIKIKNILSALGYKNIEVNVDNVRQE